MGWDIHVVAQRREGSRWTNIVGQFRDGSAPFSMRAYGVFGFLADVENYSAVPPISAPRGLPDDFDATSLDDGQWTSFHSSSWLTVDELLAYDYDQVVEDRRVSREVAPRAFDDAATAEPGGGREMLYREFLGPTFFHDLEELRRIGADRIVFAFDF